MTSEQNNESIQLEISNNSNSNTIEISGNSDSNTTEINKNSNNGKIEITSDTSTSEKSIKEKITWTNNNWEDKSKEEILDLIKITPKVYKKRIILPKDIIDIKKYENNLIKISLNIFKSSTLGNANSKERGIVSNIKSTPEFSIDDIYMRIEEEDKIALIVDGNILEKIIVEIKTPKTLSNYTNVNNINFNTDNDTDCGSSLDFLNISMRDISKLRFAEKKMLEIIYGNILSNSQYVQNHNFSIGTYIYKGEGNLNNIKSFRPIIMIPNIVKLLHKNLYSKLSLYFQINNYIDKETCKGGLRGCKSGILDQVLKVRFSIIGAKVNKIPCCVLFLDISNAFGNVDVNVLCKMLEKYCVDKKIIEYVKSYYTNFKYFFKISNKTTKTLSLKRGLIQGCPLSMFLFNIYVNYILKYINTKYLDKYGYEFCEDARLLMIAYVDDIAVVCKDTKSGIEMLKIIKDIFGQFGFTVNVKKSAYMNVNEDPANDDFLPYVTEQRYLGCTVNSTKTTNQQLDDLHDKIKKKINTVMKKRLSKEDKSIIIKQSIIPYVQFQIKFYPEMTDEYTKIISLITNCAAKLDMKQIDLFKKFNISDVHSPITKMLLNLQLNVVRKNIIEEKPEYIRRYSDIKRIISCFENIPIQ
jgi:hypothetical protein